MANEFGPKKRKDKYDIYIDKEVRISYGQDGCSGILNKFEDGTFYLNPCLVFENYVDQKGNILSRPRLEKIVPTTLEPKQMPVKIEKLSEGFLENFVKSYSLIKNNSNQ